MEYTKIVIYADDDQDDIRDVQLMLRDIDPGIMLIGFSNGLELMHYISSLRKTDDFPCFIMLDINMPVWDGIRTLQALKNEKTHGDIPVLMFSTSSSERDRELAMHLGAHSFITKPIDRDEWINVKKKISECFRELCII